MTQGGSGQRLSGLAQSGAHRLGERRWCGGVVVETQGERLVAAAVQAQQHGLGRGGGAMLDGEQQAPVAAARQIAGGIGPGVQVRGAAQRLAEVALRAFGEVMDEDESHLMATVELA